MLRSKQRSVPDIQWRTQTVVTVAVALATGLGVGVLLAVRDVAYGYAAASGALLSALVTGAGKEASP